VRATVAATTDYRGVVQELRWLFVDRSRQAEREQVRRADAVELKRLVAERTSALEHEQRLKDQLVATVSHEFRTALSAIGGYAELLAIGVRGALSVEQLEDVGRIRRANHHLVGIVDDLLSYSKLTAGTMAFDVDDMNVSDVMPTALELVAEQARLKRISVQLAPLGENVLVRADSDRVRQIIINLVGNAVKFTGEDGRVEVTVEANDADVRIRVCDTGPGIEPHALESIFQPFIRLQRTVAGTGLGLAISRELARAMKGDLVATSELGVGSCFELRLPRA
jgi:signal transduction histidine kinase